MAVSLCQPATVLFFFNAAATTEIYTLSLHDALPISALRCMTMQRSARTFTSSKAASCALSSCREAARPCRSRSEEHTSELQSPYDLVCRLLLEKKNKRRHCPGATLSSVSTPNLRRRR